MADNIPSRRRRSRRPHSSSGKSMENPNFEDGTDFIALDPISDAEDDVDDRARESDSRRKGKGKERERGREADSPPRPPSTTPPPLPSRRDSDYRDRRRDSEREWDRGKRKYDMAFDPNDGYQNKKQRTDAHSRLAPWVDQVDWDGCESTAELFHREVEGFVNWISPTPQEDEIRGLVVQIISRAVTAAFPDAQVCPFGSYATKLYLPLGDIDLVIRSRSMAFNNTQVVLQALASTIKRLGITNKVTIIGKAKVPIVKFVTNHEYGRFNVDLSINQDNGILASGIINGFLRDFGDSGGEGKKTCLALRALVLLTKLFLSQRNMNEVYTGGLGSYAIVCLVISFLQMHPKIRMGHIDPDRNLGVLVVDFFELYGRRFNYEEVGISLRDGGSYFVKRQRGWGWNESWGGGGRKGGMLSIEDPGDPTNDISSGSYNFQTVKKNLAGAHEILTATIYMRSGILQARRDGTAFSLRGGRHDPGELSILSSVMGVTQETLSNRAIVREVYEKGTLHRLVGVQPRIPPAVHVNGEASGSGSVNGQQGKSKSKSKSNGKDKDKDKDTAGSRPRTPLVYDGSATGSSSKMANGNGRPPNSDARRRQESVQDAWAEADMVMSSDDDQRRATTNGNSGGRDVEGRYAIGLSPKKRRRMGKAGDEHVVTFTVDSDSADSSEEGSPRAKGRQGKGKGKGEEEGEGKAGMLRIKGAGAGLVSRSSSNSSLSSSEKRDYWLSKGIGENVVVSD
ncbi:hypothetical protein R3P38DRAFT_2631942 [Favolaschia claudopus]|uniref:polynucleotide adenylyltransferase n=1 Tax=Favolaschia claudopus TaxID=2862362 RepID=A0AAW0B1M1_9AGAR